MAFEASCPSCAAPVRFDVANSVVTVCSNCRSVVGRGDGSLETYGKVADLVETDSPLKIGLRGKYKGVAFEITGRTQLRHSAGGLWDEWYVAFRGGRKWGWLAEAEGRYYLTFRKKLRQRAHLPAFDELEVEDEVILPGGGRMKVVEVGEATTVSAEGEIPFAFRPGESVPFADLEGPAGRFATIDGSEDPPLVFLGGEVTLAQLGIDEAVADREKQIQRVAAVQVNCPSCGGTLELQAPDSTLRVACPYCGALHDAQQGALKFLTTLSAPKKVKPLIPLGSQGTIEGREFRCIGMLQRKVTYEGLDYFWQEYLLYRPRTPFHWLIHSEGHWSFGRPVSSGAVKAGVLTAEYDGRVFKIFERATATVTYVLGEFYWKVSVGEKTAMSDFIAPPEMLSREVSWSEDAAGRKSREVNWTLSRYMPVEEVEQAFGVTGLRRPWKVGPIQPYPHKGIYKLWLAMLIAVMLVAMLVFASIRPQQVYSQTIRLEPTTLRSVSVFSQPLELKARKNIRITCHSPVRNSWLYLSGDLYNEETGLVQSFALPVEYYYGPGWTEGGQTRRVYVSALPAGRYTLRMEFQWDKQSSQSAQAKVTVEQGVPRLMHLLVVLIAISIVPIAVAIHHYSFEVRRWQDSDFSPYATGEDE